MTKLEKIQKACLFGVTIDINTHRTGPAGQRTVAEAMKDRIAHALRSSVVELVPVDPDVRDQIVATDTLVIMRLFIHGFSRRTELCHYSVEKAIDVAYDHLVKTGKIKE